MDDRGLRDIERWRDKIEVRLDNRQVFFLFFGSALVACMLFVLGVIVGKRLESRGRAVSPEIEDPLALLDKVATTPRPAQGAVTFPQALFATGGKNGNHGKKSTPPVVDTDEAKPEKLALRETKPVEAAAAVTSESKTAKPETKPAEDKQPATTKAKTEEKKPEAAAKAKPEEKKPEAVAQAKAEAKPAETKPAKENKPEKPAAIPTIGAGADSKSKGRFTLQLSSFQDKAEAEAFAQKFAGERPYLVVSEIPGKGTWYRVRVGDYASSKDAVTAKDSFEKKHNVIAYVAQR